MAERARGGPCLSPAWSASGQPVPPCVPTSRGDRLSLVGCVAKQLLPVAGVGQGEGGVRYVPPVPSQGHTAGDSAGRCAAESQGVLGMFVRRERERLSIYTVCVRVPVDWK